MQNMNLYSRGDKIFVKINITLLTLFALSTLYPFIYIIAVSFSSGTAVTTGEVIYRPIDLTIAAYKYVWAEPQFWNSYLNTFIYTIFGTIDQFADHHSRCLRLVPPAVDWSTILQSVCRVHTLVQCRPDSVLSEHEGPGIAG